MKKRNVKVIFLTAFAVALIMAAVGCESDGGGGELTPAVISVSVTPSTAEVKKGYSGQFTAVVEVSGGASQTVTWSIDEAATVAAGTSISPAGLLTLDAAETLSALTVRATSTFDTSVSGSADVTVKEPDDVSVTLSVKDEALVLGGFPAAVPVIYKTGTGAWSSGAGKFKTLAITITNASDFSSLEWKVDEVSKGTGDTLTIDAADYQSGGHSITLLAEDADSVPWSVSKNFMVQDN
jgi:hypothetical protein